MTKAKMFRREKVLQVIKEYQNLVNRARIEYEKKDLASRTAAGPEAEAMYREGAQFALGQHQAYMSITHNLMYRFDVGEEELGGEEE